MSTNDHAKRLLEYLETLSRARTPEEAPRYRDWMSRGAGVAGVAAVGLGLALSLSACGGDSESSTKNYGGEAGQTSVNPGSGGDAGAATSTSEGGTWSESQGGRLAASGGMAMDYGIFMEENCSDGIDNNGDRRVDCDDTRCTGEPECVEGSGGSVGSGGNVGSGGTIGAGGAVGSGGGGEKYGIFLGGATGQGGEATGGVSGSQNAGGQATTGGVLGSGGNTGVPAYGIFMEYDCGDKLDNDGDNLIDCDDDDCADASECVGGGGSGGVSGVGGSSGFGGSMVADYGIAMEESDCSNQVDDDYDDAIDCADTDCADDAACTGNRYGVVLAAGGTTSTSGENL